MLSDPGFRELVSLPLNANVLQGLARAGYTCVSEVASLTVERMVSLCGISTQTAQNALTIIRQYNSLSIHNLNSKDFGLFGMCTAWDLLDNNHTNDNNDNSNNNNESSMNQSHICESIVSMCSSFDNLLGGGFPVGRLTELCGEPGVGKTQFCIQACLTVQLPKWFGGLAGQAIYLDTEGNFIPKRVKQMAEALVKHCRRHYVPIDPHSVTESELDLYCPTVENLMSGIHYMRIMDHLKLLAVCKRLEQFCDKNKSIRLVVVDSIALPFRYDFDDIPQRNRLLAIIAQSLLCFAGSQNAGVVLTNQITTRLDSRLNNSIIDDCDVKKDNKGKLTVNSNRMDDYNNLVPALGDSWGHICSVRIILTRLSTGFRQIRLLKHPGRPFGIGNYQITSGGIRDIVYESTNN